VVARNGLLEKDNVTGTCTTVKGTANNGPCAWDDSNYDAAPAINLSNDPNWQRYRYRVFETIIPLRNMIWAKGTL
jgi:type IV pilus assembly protein PilW